MTRPRRRHVEAALVVRTRIADGPIGPGGEVPFASEFAKETGMPVENFVGAFALMRGSGELAAGRTPQHRHRVAGPGPG
jgi:hypothetical protein